MDHHKINFSILSFNTTVQKGTYAFRLVKAESELKKKLESIKLGKQVEKFKKGLQHSGALGADKAADGHVDVSGAPLVAVEAHLVLGTRCLDIPTIKKTISLL
jgi:hypothetical protein